MSASNTSPDPKKPFYSRFSRRQLLLGTAAIGITGTAASLFFSPDSMAKSIGQSEKPLAIPPLLTGRMEGATRVFDLDIQDGQTEFFPGLQTKTRGINGSFLGPVLSLNKGENTRFNVTSAINENTTLHWHGFNLPAKSDGGPHQIIEPGATWSPEFEIREGASTLWYHSHQMHKTAEQVWSGIAGMAIVNDEESQALGLPNNYGVDDIPIALQDRRIRQNGDMSYNANPHDINMGMMGDIPMANGTVGAVFDVTTNLVRLRLLNGANASIYTLGFIDGRTFKIIASDGGLLEKPVEAQLVQIAPGERAEIIVDMSDKTNTMLASFTQRNTGGNNSGGLAIQFPFLQLHPTDELQSSNPVPATLASIAAPDVSKAVNTRRFVFGVRGMMMGGFTINGKQMDINVINETVPVNTTEIWEFVNESRMAHPFHIHNTQFRIIDRNGRPPRPEEAGLKDTVLVGAADTVRLLIRFDEYSDAERPYMYHCHILEHEDAGMMGQFTVV
ncbi:MAG: multicopper oxidase domain-containing protein [Devosiaceae bacterium]|nr:multicopper oxidase domain-containing protein [Devosiaceae bacterium]